MGDLAAREREILETVRKAKERAQRKEARRAERASSNGGSSTYAPTIAKSAVATLAKTVPSSTHPPSNIPHGNIPLLAPNPDKVTRSSAKDAGAICGALQSDVLTTQLQGLGRLNETFLAAAGVAASDQGRGAAPQFNVTLNNDFSMHNTTSTLTSTAPMRAPATQQVTGATSNTTDATTDISTGLNTPFHHQPQLSLSVPSIPHNLSQSAAIPFWSSALSIFAPSAQFLLLLLIILAIAFFLDRTVGGITSSVGAVWEVVSLGGCSVGGTFSSAFSSMAAISPNMSVGWTIPVSSIWSLSRFSLNNGTRTGLAGQGFAQDVPTAAGTALQKARPRNEEKRAWRAPFELPKAASLAGGTGELIRAAELAERRINSLKERCPSCSGLASGITIMLSTSESLYKARDEAVAMHTQNKALVVDIRETLDTERIAVKSIIGKLERAIGGIEAWSRKRAGYEVQNKERDREKTLRGQGNEEMGGWQAAVQAWLFGKGASDEARLDGYLNTVHGQTVALSSTLAKAEQHRDNLAAKVNGQRDKVQKVDKYVCPLRSMYKRAVHDAGTWRQEEEWRQALVPKKGKSRDRAGDRSEDTDKAALLSELILVEDDIWHSRSTGMMVCEGSRDGYQAMKQFRQAVLDERVVIATLRAKLNNYADDMARMNSTGERDAERLTDTGRKVVDVAVEFLEGAEDSYLA